MPDSTVSNPQTGLEGSLLPILLILSYVWKQHYQHTLMVEIGKENDLTFALKVVIDFGVT